MNESSLDAENNSSLETPSEEDRMVEAVLFAAAEPVTIREIRRRMPHDFDIGATLKRLVQTYNGRGVQLVRAGDAWAFRTAPDLAHVMQKEKLVTRKLSRAAHETLAIIAYHQPVTRAEIEEVRGVSVSRGTLDQLIALDWVGLGRRRQSPGRPATFVVTNRFLDHFGLESTNDLPGIGELREAGLLGNHLESDLLRPAGSAIEVVGEGSNSEAPRNPGDLKPSSL